MKAHTVFSNELFNIRLHQELDIGGEGVAGAAVASWREAT